MDHAVTEEIMADIHRFLKCPTPQGWIDVAEVSSNEWMAFLKEHNLTHLNWAVSDKNEGASIIVPGANPYPMFANKNLIC
ncbi:MAG: hypothetical protein P8X89_18665 [Reinekea sp.]